MGRITSNFGALGSWLHRYWGKQGLDDGNGKIKMLKRAAAGLYRKAGLLHVVTHFAPINVPPVQKTGSSRLVPSLWSLGAVCIV
jgi:hypothetical protein